MSWINKYIETKDLKVGVKSTIVFKTTTELPQIKTLSSSCGCSVPTYSKEKRELSVEYTPKVIPQHLKSQGWYRSTKSITVTYTNGTKDVLSFTSKIYK